MVILKDLRIKVYANKKNNNQKQNSKMPHDMLVYGCDADA